METSLSVICKECGSTLKFTGDTESIICACGTIVYRPNDMQTEQPLPTEGKQSVTAALRALLDAREARGIKTYGRSLETFNGRDAPHDLVEELIDAAQYALQWELERSQLIEALRPLADCWWNAAMRDGIGENDEAIQRAYNLVYSNGVTPRIPT